MTFIRNLKPAERGVLQAVAAAGGAVSSVADAASAEECLLMGWLEPLGAHGYRLTPEGRKALAGTEQS